MTVFAYRAADRRGETIDGVMEAADARAVAERLQRDAYFPIRIAPQGQPRRLLGLAWPDLGRGRVASRDLVSFTQQLATLVEAGLPLDRALAIQVELAPTARLRAILGDVLRSVQGGSSLADALGKHHPRPFSRLYINMVRAGEKGGVLETTLRRLAGFLEESQEFRDALVSALIYPVLLTGVLAQRLVRRICQACRAPDHPDPAELLALGITDATGVELFRGKGCDECRGTGYRGRTGIYELFKISDATRSLIVQKVPGGEIRRHAVGHGMVTLREDAWAKACAGLTTVAEILRVTQEDS